MSQTIDWSGVITGTVTPFTAVDEIDWGSLERHLERLVRSGVTGILANAMMAEGLHLTTAERREVLQFILDKSADRLPIIATIFGINTQDAAEEAYRAAKAGAKALLIYPHPAFAGAPLDPEIPAAYFRAIWERASLPMIVFRLPASSAPSLDAEVLKRLTDVPGVAAVKDTVADPGFYTGDAAAFLTPESPIKVLVDDDAALLKFARLGAHGAMSICAAVDPERYIHIFRNASAPGIDEFAQGVSLFSDAVFKAPRRNFRARLKEALVLDNIIARGLVRPPLPNISSTDRTEIGAALELSRRVAVPMIAA